MHGVIRECGSIEELEALIESGTYDVISFDIFDTLITRIGNASLILKLCAEHSGLKYEELQMMRKWGKKWWGPVDDAHSYLAGTKEERSNLKKLEEKMEVDTSFYRYSMKRVYEKAVACKIKVIITSDMYLSEEIITKILSKNGYSTYDRLYLTLSGKKESTVYNRIKEDFPNSKILHLGDNYQTDCINPTKMGIDAIYIPSAIQLFENSKLKDLFKPTTLGDYVVQGLISAILFDNPFVPYKGYLNERISNYSVILGAFYTGFTLWLCKQLVAQKIDKILLVMRDGEHFENIAGFFKGLMDLPVFMTIDYSRKLRSYYMCYKKGLRELSLYRTWAYLHKRLFLQDEAVERILDKNLSSKKIDISEIDILQSKIDKETVIFNSKMLEQYVASITSGFTHIALFDNSLTGSALEFSKKYFGDKFKNSVQFQIIGVPSNPDVVSYVYINESEKKAASRLTDSTIKSALGKVNSFKDEMSFNRDSDYEVILSNEYNKQINLKFVEYFVNRIGNYLGVINVSPNFLWDVVYKLWTMGNGADDVVIQTYKHNQLMRGDYVDASIIFDNYDTVVGKICLYQIVSNSLSPMYDLEEAIKICDYLVINGGEGYEIARLKLMLKSKDPKSFDLFYKNAIELYANGNRDAAWYLGLGYARGYGLKRKDLNKAVECFKNANLSENRSLIYCDVLWELNNSTYDIELVAISQNLASIGYDKAMVYLGRSYYFGRGITKNIEKSLYWYKKAINKNDKWVPELFDIYIELNNAEDVEPLITILKDKVATGDSESMICLARAYYIGWSVPKNNAEAKKLIKQAITINSRIVKRLEKLGYFDKEFIQLCC